MPWTERDREALVEHMRELGLHGVKIMEVCGTHTMAIAKAGIRSMLPDGVELLSGPGCPVCVAPPEEIDGFLQLSSEKNIIIASYGDMLRVPGSRRGDSLLRRRAMGAQVEIVYSPVDAVELAQAQPEKQVVFLGVGFETTAPGTAAAVLTAREKGIKNFSVWPMLKMVEPALRALIEAPGFEVKGFICPGHVASVIGAEGFRFLPREYGLPGVVAGFEPEEILTAIGELLDMIASGKADVINCYPRAVRLEGNPLARQMIKNCFEAEDGLWRGLGAIPGSGLGFKEELKDFDARRRFELAPLKAAESPCRCGDVICGRLSPENCPLFGRNCTPADPVGPCMVSSEGACAAAYKYRGI